MVRLRAETPEDLTVLGGYLQDATIRVEDIAWLPKQKRFALVVNRFMWEREKLGNFRTRCGLHFETSLAAKTRNVPLKKKDHVLELLTIHAVEQDNRVLISLACAGDADIRLEAEVIDVTLEDLGDPWETPNKPAHED
ncbi:MAG: DUF2948 family protein [Proteobacteria bacterium]|nr:DUF2948 family protein [Pseudomonadota bacterium]